MCLNGTALNDKTKTLMRLGKLFDACISNHMNSTTLNSSLCSDCQDDYLNLTNYYNTNKISKEFCMDVVDLVSLQLIIQIFLFYQHFIMCTTTKLLVIF